MDNRRFLEEDSVSASDAAKSFVILLSTALALCFNTVFAVVLNTRYYAKFLRPQPRYLLGAGAANELVNAALVTAVGVYPALFECWPHGKTFCQVQVRKKKVFAGRMKMRKLCFEADQAFFRHSCTF